MCMFIFTLEPIELYELEEGTVHVGHALQILSWEEPTLPAMQAIEVMGIWLLGIMELRDVQEFMVPSPVLRLELPYPP